MIELNSECRASHLDIWDVSSVYPLLVLQSIPKCNFKYRSRTMRHTLSDQPKPFDQINERG